MGPRKISLLVIAFAGSLATAYVVLGVSGWVAAIPTTAQAAVPGTGNLSGTVESAAPFKAAQVFIRNVDKRIVYTVYTNAGQFRAVALFPGNYEVSATTKGFEAEVQKVVVKAGDNPKLKLTLGPAAATAVREEQSFDEVYPPEPGREIAERTCMICHGENFLSSRPGSESAWIARLDHMQGKALIFAPLTYPGHVRRLNVDAQNNIWYGTWSAGRRPAKLGKLDQTTGRITEYSIPRQNSSPYDVAQDPAGDIWSADVGGSHAALWKFNPRDQTFTLYPKPQRTADTPKIQITKEGAIWYAPRGSQNAPAFGVLYPDMDKISTLAAFYVNGPPGYPFKTTTSRGSTRQILAQPRAGQ